MRIPLPAGLPTVSQAALAVLAGFLATLAIAWVITRAITWVNGRKDRKEGATNPTNPACAAKCAQCTQCKLAETPVQPPPVRPPPVQNPPVRPPPVVQPPSGPQVPPLFTQNNGLTLLGVPGRHQYDDERGFCGELSLQQLMLRYGAWIPQEVARSAGGGELLLGVNYTKAMNKLRIKYEEFKGKNYKSFVEWTKEKLRQNLGVVTVAYFKGGKDSDYDHIMPIVGIQASGNGYNDNDVLYINSGYSDNAVQRRVGDYSCTNKNKKDSIKQAGCVPTNTSWGYAVIGPTYAGIGPAVELRVNASKEPGMGRTATMRGRVTVRGLQPGRAYKVHQINSLNAVPSQPQGAVQASSTTPFTATSATYSMDVSFQSAQPAYFVCVAA